MTRGEDANNQMKPEETRGDLKLRAMVSVHFGFYRFYVFNQDVYKLLRFANCTKIGYRHRSSQISR